MNSYFDYIYIKLCNVLRETLLIINEYLLIKYSDKCY